MNPSFRPSSLNELFGKPNISTLTPAMSTNKYKLVIAGSIIIVCAIVTASIIIHLQNSKAKKIIEKMQQKHDEITIGFREENDELRSLVSELITLNENNNKEGE